jgi:CheY-like chemotaxis protein
MRIQANRGQFEQVLLNLVLNARDAMPRGGVVRIETSARHENGQRWFVLRVSDSGTGMDAQTRARIFVPFFTTKGVASGTGLGLSIVYSIVERAGGTITVESATGRGSTFQVFWPATERSAASLDEVAARTERGSGSERILVVDDDPAVRRILCRMLVGLGYRPIEAGSGEQALRLAQSEPVDLIVTDVLMPESTGIDLAKHLSDLGIEAALLFISGHPERTGARELRLAEGSEFLSKPFTRDQLGERVRKMLHARAQQPKAETVC